ncbi:MAG: hypothetical protein KGY78_11435 [Anaerolineae bacterium]|nr:hypothetical protein [Anaerolineae bacterium]
MSALTVGSEQKHRIREWVGIVRASFGLENAQDLLVDLDRALPGWTIKGLVVRLAYRLLKGM